MRRLAKTDFKFKSFKTEKIVTKNQGNPSAIVSEQNMSNPLGVCQPWNQEKCNLQRWSNPVQNGPRKFTKKETDPRQSSRLVWSRKTSGLHLQRQLNFILLDTSANWFDKTLVPNFGLFFFVKKLSSFFQCGSSLSKTFCKLKVTFDSNVLIWHKEFFQRIIPFSIHLSYFWRIETMFKWWTKTAKRKII